MPSDYGHEQTDKLLKELENRIDKEYSQAAKEVQEKFYAHMKDFERKDAKMQEKLDAGKITEREYQNWRTNQMLTGQRMNALYDSLAKDLVNADQIAAGMINDSLPDVYALNMNYSTYKIEHTTEIDTNFTLYDRKTVENLMKDNPRIIPHLTEKQAARIKKDELWNRQHLVSAVAQGILQGEGIPDIAKRLQTVAAMDDNAATRNARTYITAAQNKGRIDSYERAEKLGIKTNKKWIATLDDRTRVEHRHLDGVSIPYSDVFKMDGYEIEYPGDPSAEPEMIYNCFIGDTSAYTNCEVIRSYAHQYDGDLIEIKTASGVNFTCTPNHPILTLNGWVSAASLHNGDDLLVTRIGNKFGFGRYCNIQHVFSSMKTFHDSFKRNGTIERNSALSVNFHGDVPTSEVEIVTQKRFLSNNGYSSICKSVKKFLLKFSDKTLFCKCTFMEHFRSVWLSTLGDIRHRSKLLSFFKRHLGHSEVHRLRPIALFDASGVKPLQNDVSGNIERISDCLNGFSGIVFADNIVNVNISSRCTHVYNLQTENGYYFVNSIISQKNKMYNDIVAISHNCRCTLVDDIKNWPYNDERRDEKLGDMTYEQWKHAKDKPGKDGSTKQDAEKEETKGFEYIRPEKDYAVLNENIEDEKVKSLEVKELDRTLSHDEIVEKISGGDMTKGSCASVSLAYAGNTCGLDVTDYRGGQSQDVFADRDNILRMYRLAGADIQEYKVKNEMKDTAKILENLEVSNKEYVLLAGKHSAIVRKTEEFGLQYLELQSAKENGWKLFERDIETDYGILHENVARTLNKRFGCLKSPAKVRNSDKIIEKRVELIDLSSVKPTEDFKEMLGYLNTAEGKQQKGEKGGIR